jgi:acetate kinase
LPAEAPKATAGQPFRVLTTRAGTPTAMVVATNEELLIALDTEALVK